MRRSLAFGNRILVDSSAYFALAAPHDSHHAAARSVQRRLIAERWHPFTTNLILGETYTLLLSRFGRAIAYRDIEAIRGSLGLAQSRVSRADEVRAWKIIERYDDKAFSFVDATSFAVMERLQITVAFTFDINFRQYGFQTMAP